MPHPSLMAQFISFVKRKTSQKYRFNQQYTAGKWDGLSDIRELARYSVIAGVTKHFFSSARILDLGCGEGVLLQKFAPTDYAAYLGVDFSEVAIQNAQTLKSEKASFVVGNLDSLQVNGTYDVIIYNESLYYVRNPKDAVQALFKNLAPGGIFIISMVDKHGKERESVWTELNGILEMIEKIKVSNAAGDSWTVQVYKKPR